MKDKEKLLVEAIDTYLQHSTELGLQKTDTKQEEDNEHSFQFLHEQINEMFVLKAAGLTHHDGICSAFRKVHNYKYINDPTFFEAVRKELTAQAVPHEQRMKVEKFIEDIVEEIQKENGDEKDAGYNPNLDEIIQASKPGQDYEVK